MCDCVCDCVCVFVCDLRLNHLQHLRLLSVFDITVSLVIAISSLPSLAQLTVHGDLLMDPQVRACVCVYICTLLCVSPRGIVVGNRQA